MLNGYFEHLAVPSIQKVKHLGILLGAIASAATFPLSTFGDGPDDNHPSRVRAVPPPGIEVPTNQQQTFQKAIADTRNELRAISDLSDLDRCAVEGLVRAVEMTLELNMFYSEAEIKMAEKVLDLASRRLGLLREGKRAVDLLEIKESAEKPQLIVSGFRSKIDGSIQPVGFVLPAGWEKKGPSLRMDVWLHGRDEKTSEVGFLHRRMQQPGEFTPRDTIVLHPYGRYSNAFKLAGEVDVLESIEYAKSILNIDADRIAMRGFSMGGAGCWQMAIHFPDKWFATNPGAGFAETTEFLKIFQKEDFQPTPYQKSLLHWYDCPDWSNNLKYHNTVAYSGELDRQKQAADIMEASLKTKGIPLIHVIGPKTEHKIFADSKVTIESHLSEWGTKGRDTNPDKIDFTTYSLRYASHSWIRIERLKRHWEESRIRADRSANGDVTLRTQNIDQFSVHWKKDAAHEKQLTQTHWRFAIDGGTGIEVAAAGDGSVSAQFRLENGVWKPQTKGIQNPKSKRPGLQGPIDDAFLSSFLFVPPDPTNQPRATDNQPSATDRWIEEEYKHATKEWRRHFRGEIVSKPSNEITEDDIAKNNLILFGTPASNPWIAKLVSKLPVEWKGSTIRIGQAEGASDSHVVAMIYPNPLNPDRYIVLNSGFTFREFAYLNNARQIPMLPDWALIDITHGATSQMPGQVKAAGFFDENWEL